MVHDTFFRTSSHAVQCVRVCFEHGYVYVKWDFYKETNHDLNGNTRQDLAWCKRLSTCVCSRHSIFVRKNRLGGQVDQVRGSPTNPPQSANVHSPRAPVLRTRVAHPCRAPVLRTRVEHPCCAPVSCESKYQLSIRCMSISSWRQDKVQRSQHVACAHGQTRFVSDGPTHMLDLSST